jgi:hypothetical protein
MSSSIDLFGTGGHMFSRAASSEGSAGVGPGSPGSVHASELPAVSFDDLVTDRYRDVLHLTHGATKKWGGGGKYWVQTIIELAKKTGSQTILDYGCGQGRLKTGLADHAPSLDVREFDPGIPGKDALPEPADIVCCTDVLEHVEPKKLANTLQFIRSRTLKAAFFVIALTPASLRLSDGRNAHLAIYPAGKWLQELGELYNIEEVQHSKALHIWARV